jgi:hypothetical protein
MTPPPPADEPEYLKVEEVAARLKLKEKTICQDDLSTAAGAAAFELMTIEHQDIEAIAHRVVELLEAPPRKLLTVAEVARLLAVEPGFVYAHQAELGVVRLPGKGRRPALRFDRDTLLERLDRSHATHDQPSARRGRRAQRARDATSLIELLPYEPRTAI